MYRFGAVWHWKCSRVTCRAGGRSRALSDAYDSALGHILSAHRATVRVDTVPRSGRFHVWRATLGPYELGHIAEYPILDGFVYGPVRKSPFPNGEPWFCYSPRFYLNTDISMAVHELMEMHGYDDKWLTSTRGYALAVATVGAPAREGAGRPGPAELNEVQERMKEPSQ